MTTAEKTVRRRTTGEMFEGHAVYLDTCGYACIWLDGKSVKVHLIVWKRAHGLKPKGYDIHHKDENKGNYALENLELLSRSDHLRVHARWIRVNGEWVAKPCPRCVRHLPLSEFYPRISGGRPSSLCKSCNDARRKAVRQKIGEMQ